MSAANGRRRTPVPGLGLLLYLGLVFLSTMAVAAGDWADHIALIPLFGLLGAVTGALLARSLFGGGLALLVGSAYGLFATSVFLAETLDPAFAWRERLLILWSRFHVFLTVVLGGLRNQDPLMVVVVLCLLYWAMAAFGAWALFRRRAVWAAVVPMGVALFVNTLYYIGPARLDLLLAAYLTLALLLILYQELRDRQVRWQAVRARVPAHAVGYLIRVGAVFALGLVVLAWAGPAFAQSEGAASVWTTISAPWRAARDRLGNAVSGLRSPVMIVGDEFAGDLQLEAGVQPEDIRVMEVAPQDDLRGPGRFYWRARSYAIYEGGGWSSDLAADVRYNPNSGDIELPESAAREEVEIVFAVDNAVQRILYLPAQPVWVNRTSELRAEQESGQIVDVSAVLSVHPVYRGETYRARASVAVPTAGDLRSAGEEYPDWVRERYLQVPETVTPRTRELARRIAGDLPTAYDKAEAITAWLRSNIEYSRVTPAPPPDQEPLDWFLFEYSTGFCNYYATAEVMMLRLLGVPARMAVGYARGEYAADRGVYEVSAQDYHAWPEVYFPGYGWVEFEPTVSEPPLTRPEPIDAAGAAGTGPRSGQGSRGEAEELQLERMEDLLTQGEAEQAGLLGSGIGSVSWRVIGFGLLTLTAALGLLWTRLDVAWKASLAGAGDWLSRRTGVGFFGRLKRLAGGASPAELAYRRWVGWLPRLGIEVHDQQTPHERAGAFAAAYPALAAGGWELVEAYTRQRFAQDSAGGRSPRRTWVELQRPLWSAWLRRLGRGLLRWAQRPEGEADENDLPWSLRVED